MSIMWWRISPLKRGRPWGLIALLLMAIYGAAGCSRLLAGDGSQCATDTDCARFPDAICNRTTELCVGRPRWPPDAASLSSAEAGHGETAAAVDSGGAAADSAAPSVDGGPSSGTASRCADLDGNGVQDCYESLLANSAFDVNAAGWTAEVGMSQSFVDADAGGRAGSGSMGVTNTRQSATDPTLTMGGAQQCVRDASASRYEFAAQVLVTPPADPLVKPGLAVQFYGSVDCSGASSGTFNPPLAENAPGWQLLRGTFSPPAATRSLMVRLVVVKPFQQPPAQALFDNILLVGR